MNEPIPQNIKYENWRDVMRPNIKPVAPPKIDPYASEIVGRDIMANDPKLIQWAAAKARVNRSDTIPTKMLEDKVNRRELSEIFHGKHQVS